MEDFQSNLARLNPAQKQAVKTIEGPLLVIAGPGTGKTQLLAMRVANILRTTDTNPANILCLTFTNKASVNMKERIIQLAGSAAGRTVVKTFHSFAAEIMNAYPDYFWNTASLNIAPETVQLDIIESIVAELPLDNPLAMKFAGQFTLISDIQRAISLTKDAGLTPEKLSALIDSNLAYIDVIEPELTKITTDRLSSKSLNNLLTKVSNLPLQKIDRTIAPLISLSTVINESLEQAIINDEGTSKTTNTGKWKKQWIQTVDSKRGMFQERKRNLWWKELAGVYGSYRDEIHKRGFYDYADMLVEVITQLETHPQLRSEVQERFLYVLIDEFQDTNPAQLRLSHLISEYHEDEGNPNLMAVGDDDQSIFKFNGAELNNMLGFKRIYQNAETIVLKQNYRSTQEVLNAAKDVIEQAQDRLVTRDKTLNKDIKAATDIKPGKIEALSYSSRELQLSSIAREIQKRYKTDKDIAVLARNHDGLLKMTSILQGLGVPVRYEQQSNVLEHEAVEQAYTVAKVLESIKAGDKDSTDALIHLVLRHPMWNVPAQTLWELAIDNSREPNWLKSLLSHKESSVRDIGNWFVTLAKQSDNQPLAVTIEQIIGLIPTKDYTSPMRDYFLIQQQSPSRYLKNISAIQLLRSLIYEFSLQAEPSLTDFIKLVELSKSNNKIIADESPFVSGENAVQLLTIHKAKGLEFNSVYLIDAVESNWSPKKGSRKPPANLPLLPPGDELDDYVRLMYVALTRAKQNITISAYYLDHAGKEVAESPIMQGAFDIKKIDEKNQTTIIEILEENMHWPQLDQGNEKAMLKARLETYSLSVTHLLNFLDLRNGGPQYFKEKNLLYLPEAKQPHLSYGTAIHAALDHAQKLTNKDDFQLKKVQAKFSEALSDEQLRKPEFVKFNKQGRQVLAQLFQKYGYLIPKDGVAEQAIKDVRLRNAVIRGTIDRMFINDSKVEIIDYKTGKPLASLVTRDKTKMEKAWRHKTQLVFYVLLLRNSSRFYNIAQRKIEGQMVYIEAESKKELVQPYTPNDEEITNLQKLVEIIYSKVVNLDLPDVSKYSKDFEGTQKFEQDLLEGKI